MLGAKKDSIDTAYKIDIDQFNKDFLDYMNKCAGGGSDNGKCKELSTKLANSKSDILEKYFFSNHALYASYLNDYRNLMKLPLIKTALDAIKLSELSLMGAVAFPHKQDLASLDFADGVIAQIKSVYVIDVKLWL